jgi:integrase
MGRYPFLTATKAYLDDVRHYYRPTSLEENGRKLRYLAKVFEDLRRTAIAHGDRGFSANPITMGEHEIAAFLGWMKERGLQPATQHKNVGVLGGLLDWAGNATIRQMRLRKRFRIVVPPKILYSLSESDLERIRRAADSIDGWRGEVARFLGILPFCALRSKEIRLANLADLDTNRWLIRVSSPKGEGAWAAAGEPAPILPPARQIVADYLVARADYLRKNGFDPSRVEPLIPYLSPRTGKIGTWDDSVLIRLKCEVEKRAGVPFKLKDFRPTCAQLLKDRGVGIEAVSKILRHRTTRTTELFYARIRDEKAFAEAERAWTVGLNPPLIEKRQHGGK